MAEPKYRPRDMIQIIRESKEYTSDNYGRIYIDSSGKRIGDVNSDSTVSIHVDVLGPESLLNCIGLYKYCEKIGFPVSTPKEDFTKQKDVIKEKISELERISESLKFF